MSVIVCSELDCVDGACKQRCIDFCGGEVETSDFQCGLSGLVCRCLGTTNSSAAVWGGVFGLVCALLCVAMLFQYLRERRNKRAIVVA
jgi:hypothetical protein